MASEIAGTHHERWDGNGYVAGLVGAEIPLAGRITALADVWDTLTHERPYKPAWDEDRALAEIDAQAGAHFDPRIVEAFLAIDRRLLRRAAGRRSLAPRRLSRPRLGTASSRRRPPRPVPPDAVIVTRQTAGEAATGPALA